MNAPERFAAWLSTAEHRDRRFGHLYRYHPRSNAHSTALYTYILDDLLDHCPMLQTQAARGAVAYGINLNYVWPTTQKAKYLDLAVGQPATRIPLGKIVEVKGLTEVFLACEAKSVPLIYSRKSRKKMVRHLRGLPIREQIGQVGFEAHCMIVVDCNNQAGATLWEGPPAPQPGERDHYGTFIECLARFYMERFGRRT